MNYEPQDENLEKVYVDLPNHWAVGGESIWAKALGNNLYEVRNTPFYAYGLNWGDVVRAEAQETQLKPEVLEVVKPSGNKTLRIVFDESIDRNLQGLYLETLKRFNLSYERANESLIALDLAPEANYEKVCGKLFELEQEGILEYETCEVRINGSFDGRPEEEE